MKKATYSHADGVSLPPSWCLHYHNDYCYRLTAIRHSISDPAARNLLAVAVSLHYSLPSSHPQPQVMALRLHTAPCNRAIHTC